MSVGAVVVAAGRGERFGGAARKQFVELAGEPVVARACRPFLEASDVAEVVLVLPAEIAGDPPGWVDPLGIRIVAGGLTRRDSVSRGLAGLSGDVERVLVHDGVRPLVTGALLLRVLDAVGGGGAVPALPVVDTVKEVEGERVVRTLERGRLRRVQTPQGFRRSALERAHAEVEEEATVTDDASLLEAIGLPVHVVRGEERNLKITTREDLDRAERLLREARRRRSGAGGSR